MSTLYIRMYEYYYEANIRYPPTIPCGGRAMSDQF